MTAPRTNRERPNDEELLRRHVQGDRPAFEELVRRYTDELHRFLARFLGQRAWVEDAIQETFLQVHVSAATFDATRRVKPWLFTIAANKARDLLRTRTRRREVSLDQPAGPEMSEDSACVIEQLAVDESLAIDDLAELEEAERVRRVVMSLPEHYREVLILGYYHQFPYRDIAEILSVPIGTVKSRLHAAVAHFATAYKRMLASSASSRNAAI